MNDFMSKMKNYLDRGVEVSKEALVKAGGKVQDFSDKSVVRIEISQLEGKVDKELQRLGAHVYALLGEQGRESISRSDGEIGGFIAEVKKLRAEIETKKEHLAESADSLRAESAATETGSASCAEGARDEATAHSSSAPHAETVEATVVESEE